MMTPLVTIPIGGFSIDSSMPYFQPLVESPHQDSIILGVGYLWEMMVDFFMGLENHQEGGADFSGRGGGPPGKGKPPNGNGLPSGGELPIGGKGRFMVGGISVPFGVP
jgi:hypothetical protein